MVKRPYGNITIGSTVFDKISAVECSSSWDDMTDRATVTMPKNIKFLIGKEIFIDPQSLFKKGNYVNINLGYYPNSREVFRGYISEVTTSIPFVIHLQDAMWLLKQSSIKNYSAKQVKLKNLLADILPSQFKNITPNIEEQQYSFYCDDVNLGDFVIRNNATVADVLNELRSKYTLFSWFRKGVLYVGLRNYPQDPFYKTDSKTAIFNFETVTKDLECVIDGSNLEYKQADDVKIKLVVKNMISKEYKNNPNFSEQKVYNFGDSEGDTVEQVFYNVPISEIQKAALNRISELKYTGYRGEFVTFGEPFVQHGDIAELRSKLFPERDGKYQIKSVKRSYTWDDGYRQVIGLSTKV